MGDAQGDVLGRLQLGGSLPDGVEAAGRVRVRVAVLLGTYGGPEGVDRGRAGLTTLNAPLRSADLALKQRGSRLARDLLLILRAEILSPPAPAFPDGCVLWRRHQLVVQLNIIRGSP